MKNAEEIYYCHAFCLKVKAVSLQSSFNLKLSLLRQPHISRLQAQLQDGSCLTFSYISFYHLPSPVLVTGFSFYIFLAIFILSSNNNQWSWKVFVIEELARTASFSLPHLTPSQARPHIQPGGGKCPSLGFYLL